ncbi:MAG: response regulator transcription factor [Ferruginibacter sp.]
MKTSVKKINIALADDHALLRKSLANYINNLEDFKVLFDVDNGDELVKQINKHNIPDIVILDVNMPVMDGYQTAQWLKTHHPYIKVVILSMFNNETTVIRMLKLGVKGYLLKSAEPEELQKALKDVYFKDFYYSEFITGKLLFALNEKAGPDDTAFKNFTEKELRFLEFASTDMSYQDIAAQMNLSRFTIDDYRNNLFDKCKVKSRVGLVVYAIKNNLISIK